jgi:hypothetical protein
MLTQGWDSVDKSSPLAIKVDTKLGCTWISQLQELTVSGWMGGHFYNTVVHDTGRNEFIPWGNSSLSRQVYSYICKHWSRDNMLPKVGDSGRDIPAVMKADTKLGSPESAASGICVVIWKGGWRREGAPSPFQGWQWCRTKLKSVPPVHEVLHDAGTGLEAQSPNSGLGRETYPVLISL